MWKKSRAGWFFPCNRFSNALPKWTIKLSLYRIFAPGAGRTKTKDESMAQAKKGLLVWLSVSDLDTACGFYADTLGLTLAHMDPQIGWAEFALPGSDGRVGLRETDEDEIIPAGGATLTFDVDNLEEIMGDLEKAGVMFITGVMSLNGHRFATFIDPDGNNLQLRQAG